MVEFIVSHSSATIAEATKDSKLFNAWHYILIGFVLNAFGYVWPGQHLPLIIKKIVTFFQVL